MLGATFFCFALASIAGLLGFNAISLLSTVIANVLLAVLLVQIASERLVDRFGASTKHSDR